jgi:hypothetical protein
VERQDGSGAIIGLKLAQRPARARFAAGRMSPNPNPKSNRHLACTSALHLRPS